MNDKMITRMKENKILGYFEVARVFGGNIISKGPGPKVTEETEESTTVPPVAIEQQNVTGNP